ncbi:MAG: type II toxin-antitoxin system HigB family toxin [Pirellulales bacterium]|nr:type II toxin-antitoxin system HigB family toxin [Pirellulales bacterium]
MHVISEKKLRQFWEKWPEAETPLRAWHRVAEHAQWQSFAEVRDVYPHADRVGRCTIFNIGGNKFRLVAVIYFNRGKLYIRHVLTHEEYDGDKWKEDS